MEYSNIFGYRKYRAHIILEEFCNRYYDNSIYRLLKSWEPSIKEYINNEIESYIDFYKSKGTTHLMKDQIAKLAEWYAGQFFDTKVEPNGEMRYPDYIINIGDYKNVYVDSKCVAYIPRKNNDI